MKKTALITGATSGIGWATAQIFASAGIQIVACGRRQERLDQLAKEIGHQTAVHTLTFDIRDKQAVFAAVQSLPAPFQQIHILVNNAGNAHGLDTFDQASIEDFEAMIDINVKGLLYMSKAIIPQMIARQQGDIINIGSIAGKEVYPKGHVYCGSKAAVDAINQGMRMDLHSHQIRVSAIHPGLVQTEFSDVRFKGDSQRAKTIYQGYKPLTANDVAECILFAITRPAHVNIADLLILPTAQAASTIVHKN